MKDLQENLNRNIDFIRQADTKAAFIATVLIASAGYLLASLDIKANIQSGWFIALSIACATSFLVTSYFIVMGIHPTIKEKIAKPSLIYYGAIAVMDLETFKRKRRKLDEDKLEDFVLDQIYVTSVIANSKMKSVQRAFYAVLAFVVLSLVHVGVFGVAF